MPDLRKFEKLYGFPKSFALKADVFEIKNAMDLRTREYRSVKIYRKSELTKDRLICLKREINLLRQFDHPNIVKIHDVIEDETKVYCVIDNIKGPSLFQYVLENKQVSIAHTVTVAAQILSVIAYMHKRDFVLRRINMETVFLSDANSINDIKLCDFFFLNS